MAAALSLPSSPDPRTSEDCLFLDVIVPQKIFDERKQPQKSTVPTLVWLYGGGFTSGEKTGSGGGSLFSPAGLFNTSKAAGSEGFVFVAINYRVRPSKNILREHALILRFSWELLGGLLVRICKRMEPPTLDFTTRDLRCNGFSTIFICSVGTRPK